MSVEVPYLARGGLALGQPLECKLALLERDPGKSGILVQNLVRCAGRTLSDGRGIDPPDLLPGERPPERRCDREHGIGLLVPVQLVAEEPFDAVGLLLQAHEQAEDREPVAELASDRADVGVREVAETEEHPILGQAEESIGSGCRPATASSRTRKACQRSAWFGGPMTDPGNGQEAERLKRPTTRGQCCLCSSVGDF